METIDSRECAVNRSSSSRRRRKQCKQTGLWFDGADERSTNSNNNSNGNGNNTNGHRNAPNSSHRRGYALQQQQQQQQQHVNKKPSIWWYGWMLACFVILFHPPWLLFPPVVQANSVLEQFFHALNKLRGEADSDNDDATSEQQQQQQQQQQLAALQQLQEHQQLLEKTQPQTLHNNHGSSPNSHYHSAESSSSGSHDGNHHNSGELLAPHAKRLGLYQHSLHRHYVQTWQEYKETAAAAGEINVSTVQEWVEETYATFLNGYHLEPDGLQSHLPSNDSSSSANSHHLHSPLHRYRAVLDERQASDGSSFPPFPNSKRTRNLQLLQEMWIQGYDAYLYHGWPAGEVGPLSCRPKEFSLVPIPGLTLLDSLDTLLLLGNVTEFARAVERVRHLHETTLTQQQQQQQSAPLIGGAGGLFDLDQNVSVFETNIRVLGGLLSAHQMAEAWLPAMSPVLKHDVFLTVTTTTTATGSTTSADSSEDDEPGFTITNAVRTGRDDITSGSCAAETAPTTPDVGDPVATALAGLTPPGPAASSLDSETTTTTTAAEPLVTATSASAPATAASIKNATSHLGDAIPAEALWTYDGLLLDLAHDIGHRLLPAFDTATGIPYGTVHLQTGIPPGETTVASLAGGGTVVLEFELLSRLTGDPRFGLAAKRATRSLWLKQSMLYLLGKHIDVQTGTWTETLSGIGSNSDSFTEYLAKYHFLFASGDFLHEFFTLFVTVYSGIFLHLRRGDWYADADMHAGNRVAGRRVLEALMAFYPGLQVLQGEVAPAARSLSAQFMAREYLGFLPERFLFDSWKVDHGAGAGKHLLRPELLESSYLLHRASLGLSTTIVAASSQQTSSGWLWASDFALNKLAQLTPAPCGFASLSDVRPHVTGGVSATPSTAERHLKRMDEMPSFFLTETIKYLYLTFDHDNVLHHDDAWNDRNWIFTTEAHPIAMPSTEHGGSQSQHQDQQVKKKDSPKKESSSKEKKDGETEKTETSETGDKPEHEHLQHDDQQEKDDFAQQGLHLLEHLLLQRLQGRGKVKVPKQWDPHQSVRKRKARTNAETKELWTSSNQRSEFIKSVQHVQQQVQEMTTANRRPATLASSTTIANFFGYGNLMEPLMLLENNSAESDKSSLFSSASSSSPVDDGPELWNEAHYTWGPLGLQAGFNLLRACPNWYAPQLVWMHALHGGALDYVPRFVSVTHDAQFVHVIQQHQNPVPVFSTTRALRYFGSVLHRPHPSTLSLFVGAVDDFLDDEPLPDACYVQPPETPDAHQAMQRQQQHQSQQQLQQQLQQLWGEGGGGGDEEDGFTEIHTEMGTFQVKAFEGGTGFGVEHVESGDLLSATFVQDFSLLGAAHDEDSLMDATFVMIHALYPRREAAAGDSAAAEQESTTKLNMDSQTLQVTMQQVARMAAAAATNDERETMRKLYHAEQGTHDRVVIMADMNGNSFSCDVELVQMNVDSNQEVNVVYQIPCTPALFGPTHMARLVENDGDLIVEGVLSDPYPDDLYGCEPPKQVNSDVVEETEEGESCPNHIIQLVHRGQCSFIEKSFNSRHTRDSHGTIVINSDSATGTSEEVFIMSYGHDDYQYLKQALPVTVLISASDGSDLQQLVSFLQSGGVLDGEDEYLTTRIALRRRTLTEQQISSLTNQQGDEEVRFPMVKASSSLLRVFSRGEWGIQAAQQQLEGGGATNWHLQLMRHEFKETATHTAAQQEEGHRGVNDNNQDNNNKVNDAAESSGEENKDGEAMEPENT